VGSEHLVVGVDSVYRAEVPAADRDYSRSKWSEGGFPYGNIAWTGARRADFKRLKGKSVFANVDVPLGDTASVDMEGRLMWAGTVFRYAPSVGTFDILHPSADLLQQQVRMPDP